MSDWNEILKEPSIDEQQTSSNVPIEYILTIDDEEINKQIFESLKYQIIGISEQEMLDMCKSIKLPTSRSSFKLEVLKRNKIDDGFIKLNKTMIISGPIQGINYYSYNKKTKKYILLGNLTKFNQTYRKLTQEELLVGPKENIIYFTKDLLGNYIKTINITQFSQDTDYYICLFNNDYYIKRKQ